MDSLILDHHLVDMAYESDRVVVVNNQLSEKFPNKSLSGAGMVYKFIQAYSKTYGGDADKYVDLAMLGILSDMMLITELDNNFIIKKGLNNINNKMFKALLKKQSYSSFFGLSSPTIIDIVFYVTPVINGTIRMGSMQEKAQLFEAFTNNTSTELISREWRGEFIEETLYDKVARESYNIKEKQNRITLKTMDRICDAIDKDRLDQNQSYCL